MKLLYLIAGTYRAAGMERVLANKANWFAEQRNADGGPAYEVLIATTDQRGRVPAFELNPGIRCIDLEINYEENNGGTFLNKVLRYPLKQVRHRKALRKLLAAERPDIVVSMFCNDASFVPGMIKRLNSKSGCNTKTVLEIHFSRFKLLQYGRKGIWALADRYRSSRYEKTAARFDRFVVLTEEDRHNWGALDNICVIPNARTFKCAEPADLDDRQVLAMGRYSSQKAPERMLEVWKLARREGWTLRLAGDGELRPELESKIREYGLQDSVLLGPCSDALSEYRRSSIFILTSRYEGLPMVLLEAQAAGLPIVSVACQCGPKDVITDGKDGFLVPGGKDFQAEAFAEKLCRLMDDDKLRHEMGRAAFASSARYDETEIMLRWQRLFDDLCVRL